MKFGLVYTEAGAVKGRRDVWRPSDWNRTDFREKSSVVFQLPAGDDSFVLQVFVLHIVCQDDERILVL